MTFRLLEALPFGTEGRSGQSWGTGEAHATLPVMSRLQMGTAVVSQGKSNPNAGGLQHCLLW